MDDDAPEATPPDRSRRWDNDDRGTGIADASAELPRIVALGAHAGRTGWVAEEPGAHLWPHLERAIRTAGSPWRSARWSVDGDGRLIVDLEHVGDDADRPLAAVRADAFALIGHVAETSSFVRVVELAETNGREAGHDRPIVQMDVVTGLLDDETSFASHGHTVRLRIARVAR
jgi:hypothetical protein